MSPWTIFLILSLYSSLFPCELACYCSQHTDEEKRRTPPFRRPLKETPQVDVGYDAENSQGEEEDVGHVEASIDQLVPPKNEVIVEPAPLPLPLPPPTLPLRPQAEEEGYLAEDSQGHTDDEKRTLTARRAPEKALPPQLDGGYEAEDR